MYVTIKQAAGRLCVSESHVRRLVASGDLRASNLGLGKVPAWRIDCEDLKAFARRRATTARRNRKQHVEHAVKRYV